MECGSGISASFSIPDEWTLTSDLTQHVAIQHDVEETKSQNVEESKEEVKERQEDVLPFACLVEEATTPDVVPNQNVEFDAAPNVESEEQKGTSSKDEPTQPKLSKKVLARIAKRTEKLASKAVLCPVEDALSAHRAKHPVVIDSAPSGYKQEENGAYYKETPDEMDTTRIFKEASNLRADVERLIASDKASTDRYNADAAEGNKRSYVTKEGLRNCFGIPRERDPYLYLKMKMPVIFDLLVDPTPQTDIERYMELLRVMCHEKELVKTGKKNKHLADATVEAHAHKIYNTKPPNLR
jgi:hypothetical protein